MNHLKTAITHLGFLLIYTKRLTLLTMQYYLKSLEIMELSAQILPGLAVTSQIGNNTMKALMTAKAIYKILHVEDRRAPLLDRFFF